MDDVVYCETCWLFADRSNPLFKMNWIDGIIPDKNVCGKIQSHEICQSHILAIISKNQFLINPLELSLLKQMQVEENFWCSALRRIFNIILTISSANMALRGHRDSIVDSKHTGNFFRIVKLLSKFDETLKTLINDDSKKIKYLSSSIQNEIINLLGNFLRQSLISETIRNKFYSIILDSTQDVSRVEQVSLTLRYVDINYEQKTKNKGNISGILRNKWTRRQILREISP